VVKVKSTDLY